METDYSDLEKRVSYLEEELDTSYEQNKFERTVEQVFPDKNEDRTIEFRSGHYGYFARVTGIDGNEIQYALDRFSVYGYGTAVTETASGVGMEVWLEPEF